MKSSITPRVDTKNTEKHCEITFIIGNGFDLGLGMKTKYTDVYDGYIQFSSTSDVINHFKEELMTRSSNNYEKWSDFEMGMAEYAKTLKTESELIECVRDFKSFMVEYLREENAEILELLKENQNESHIFKELDRSLEHFYEGLTPNDVAQIKSIIADKDINRNYITFNYTLPLDALFNINFHKRLVQENDPIHIHGKLGEDIVLGIDNLEQLIGAQYDITKKTKRAFVKTIFNAEFDKGRFDAAVNAILGSSIICVYGFSMGESDNCWVWLLSDWLLKDKKHHLVFYKHNTPQIDRHNSDEIMDVEDELKLELLKRLEIEDDSVLEQIHIPIGKKLFQFHLKEPLSNTLNESQVFHPLNTYESKSFALN